MKLIHETYEYVWPNDSCRSAEIIKTDSTIVVQYRGVNAVYNQDDWQFLHDLSIEVLKMYKPSSNKVDADFFDAFKKQKEDLLKFCEFCRCELSYQSEISFKCPNCGVRGSVINKK